MLGLFLMVLSGCPVPSKLLKDVPHDAYRLTDAEFNRDYYVYLPTAYGKRPLPLVVTCHGTNPWDSAPLQIKEWKYLAEKYQFVVVAPFLNSPRGFIPPSAGEGIAILRDDERFILKVIRRFINNPNIDMRATMITGWSAGGFATYWVGLRHPEIFRVVSARECNFIKEYYTGEVHKFNPYQPVLIFYGVNDMPLLKADSFVAYRFLKSAGLENLFFKALDDGHVRHPEVALDFFMNSIKIYPRPTILSAKLYGDGKCRVRYDSNLVGPPDEKNIYWDFGDGDSASGRVVEHVYSRPGKYEIAVMHSVQNKVYRFTGSLQIDSGGMSVKPEVKK